MTRTSCTACRLRFPGASATTSLASCPFCAGPLQALPASALMGFKLLANVDLDVDDLAVEQALARSAVIRPADPS